MNKKQCNVCNKESTERSVVCSEKCRKIRLLVYDIDRKYFPTNGCDNCWGDLHSGCSEQCKQEFRDSLKFGTDLWALVHFITGHIRTDKKYDEIISSLGENRPVFNPNTK